MEKMKILIVDDMEVNLELLEARLVGSGYEVTSAKNGIEALDELKRDSIDMIISDILMPKMDGYQLCRECKQSDILRKIPFVFYTATYTDKKDEEFALSLGAERFIVKPAESKLFVEIIEGILENNKKGLLTSSEIPGEEEEVYLKEYNERLINKLEKKMLDLESEITERKRTEEELEKHREHLEEMVKERTAELTKANQHLRQQIEERKLAEEALRESEKSLAEAQRVAHMGNWDLDLVKDELRWSDEIYRIFGLKPQEFDATYEAFLNTIHPNDREFVDTSYTKSVESNTPYDIVHRIVRPDGEVRYVHEKAEDIKDETGKMIRSIGTVQDITEGKKAEDALKKSTAELQKMVNLMAGRELRMAELKETIQKLRTQLESAGMTPVADDPLKKI
jgi:PAS domain S-box-containing protein